ncbi:hypothetical protein HOB30_02055 [Candidatus Falkowbacteria bacterium]|jgi:hypothetical protein|nr:hypothetical protein [Candidatus Falkowbacteria bacterium]
MLTGNKKEIRILKCISFFDKITNQTSHKLIQISFFVRKRKRHAQIFISKDLSLISWGKVIDEFIFLGSKEQIYGVFVSDLKICESTIERAISLVLSEIGVLKSVARFKWNAGHCEKNIINESALCAKLIRSFSQ